MGGIFPYASIKHCLARRIAFTPVPPKPTYRVRVILIGSPLVGIASVIIGFGIIV
jgi:hypothetical protein